MSDEVTERNSEVPSEPDDGVPSYDQEFYRILTEDGVEAWNRRRHQAGAENPNLRGADLSERDLDGADLSQANLARANLKDASLEAASFTKANLTEADLEGVDLAHANLAGARLIYANLKDAHLEVANLKDAHLIGADLKKAHLFGANLTNAHLMSVHLEGTDLKGVEFDTDHQAMHDGSSSIVLPLRDRHLNWGVLRRVGSLPLFEVSYGALAISIVTINAVGYLNRTQVSQWFEYPIEMPARMTWLFVSALFLGIGTTIYRLRCPERVQTFSETEWVEQHGRPRLQYFAESLTRRGQIPTAFFTAVGGALGVALLLERIWATFRYLIANL